MLSTLYSLKIDRKKSIPPFLNDSTIPEKKIIGFQRTLFKLLTILHNKASTDGVDDTDRFL
jgi:hypothetical protein